MIADAASSVVTGNVDAGVLVVFVPLLACAVALSGPTARRIGCGRLLAGLALVALAGILAVTLGVRAVDGGGLGNASLRWITDGDLWASSFDAGAGWWLNVALFVPAGLLVGVATTRAWWTLVGLIGLSALVEVVQGLGLLGAADPADVVANSIGAAIGCCLSIPVRRLIVDVDRPVSQRPLSSRNVLLGAAGVIAVVGMGWLALVAGADARRDSLAKELRVAFAGTTSVEIEAKLDSADGFEEMMSATSVRPGYLGRVGDTDEYEGRWSTEFFGLHRCVFVRWTVTGMGMRDGAGDECTIFRERPPAS